MNLLARFFVTATDLFEAEGRALKQQLARLFVAAGLGLIVFGSVAAGLGFLLFSLFMVLAARLTPAGATFAMGVVAMLLAWSVFLYARHSLWRAMSIAAQPANGPLIEAKLALIGSAQAMDPFSAMRRSPFIMVGAAAGIGAILGSNRGHLMALVKMLRAFSSLVRLIAITVGQCVAAGTGHDAAEMREKPDETLAAA